jgi:predicted phosphodiesterase
MRLLILSDLHHELWREHAPRLKPSSNLCDVVILAGDIDSGANAVAWASQTFPDVPVVYVLGNHEAYGRKLEEVHEEIELACTKNKNVHFLNCNEHRIGDVRFLGATLWTDFELFGPEKREEAMSVAEKVLTDYRRIRLADKEGGLLRASDTIKIHVDHRAWLQGKLAESFLGKTVVITHMAPSIRSISDRFANDLASAGFASRMDDLVNQADIWIHGHTHDSFDYRIGRCRVICNPCGYMTRGGGIENAHFKPDFIVDL